MKVLQITSFDNGGAGTAALRLHKGLLQLNVQSKVLVLEKRTGTETVFQYKKQNKYYVLFQRLLKKAGLPLTLEHKNDNLYKSFTGDFEYFSFAKTSFTSLIDHPLVKECDIINLHWVANFIDYASFFSGVGKPIVWTQHDLNAFQGGFHYKEDEVRNPHLMQIDKQQYNYKLNALLKLPAASLATVSPSTWMHEQVSSSEILGRFKHRYIPNGIDPFVFKYKDHSLAKKEMMLDEKKITILYVSETLKSIRKGYKYIKDLIEDPELTAKCEFVAVGKIKQSQKIDGVKYMGIISSETAISDIYNSSDILLLASREDNLPNVMLESLSTGTPVVAFNTGGIKDLVKNGVTGYLSEEMSSAGLKTALLKCIYNIQSFNRLEISKQTAAAFSIEKQAEQYKALYKEMLQENT